MDIEAVTDHVQRLLSLPASAREAVVSAVAASSERTGVSYIDAEIAALPSRFGFEDPGGPSRPPDLGHEVASATLRAAARQSLTFVGHYVPPVAPAASTIYRSVRFRAEQFLQAAGPSRTTLTYAWQPAGRRTFANWLGRLRRLNCRQAIPTHLPIDLSQGRELTLPIKIRTPDQPGLYKLLIYPMAPSAKGGRGPYLHTIIEVQACTGRVGFRERVNGVQRGPVILNYGVDHALGVTFLREYMTHKYPSGFKLLEIASGVNPHAASFADAGTVIASDVCSNQMQLGAIYARHHFPSGMAANVGFASFDAFNAPFQPSQFDGIAMFSALHHFPDPVALLAKLTGLVRPGGFLAVLCEPCDPSINHEAYVRDLLRGINEQMFTVEEYLHIFKLAGLASVAVRDDGGSLKAILERE